MLTLAMTAGNDNQAVWVLKVNLDTTTLYLSTKTIALSNTYSGEILSYEGMSDITFNADIQQGSGTGSIGNLIIAVPRYIPTATSSEVDGFINEFFPASAGKTFINRTVELGIVWEGATTDAEITWLQHYYFTTYDYTPTHLIFGLYDIQEFNYMALPFYKIQKEYDNGISYYPYAPIDNYGRPIPFVYGDFSYYKLEYGDYNFVPGICVNERDFTFACSNHWLHTIVYPIFEVGAVYRYYLFRWIEGINTYMIIKPNALNSGTNTFGGHTITLNYGQAEGIIYKQMNKRSYRDATLTDFYNSIDKDEDTYSIIEGDAFNDTAGWCFDGGYIKSEFGALGPLEADFYFYVLVEHDFGAGLNVRKSVWYTETNRIFSDGIITTGKQTQGKFFGAQTLNYSDVFNWDFTIEVLDEEPNDFKIYNAYLLLTGIDVRNIMKRVR